jgi:OFA family oxalate/formate antiporter-like MFS transporter
MTIESTAVESATAGSSPGRWNQLVVGVLCMVMIANLQYGWTLFVNPIDQKYHWGTTAIQVAFSVFIATETWLVPIEGWFVDRFGPRIVVAFGGVLVAIAWTLNSFAGSLAQLYIAAALSGVGAGAVYGTCVGNALKWFPDRRGLAAGLTAAGFGAGTAATVIPIRDMILAMVMSPRFFGSGWGRGSSLSCCRSFCVRRRPARRRSRRPGLRIRCAIIGRSKYCGRRSSGSFTSCSSWFRPRVWW